MKLTDFDALSFDCYGTLIDWEAGIAAVLGPWARSRELSLDDDALLSAYSDHETRLEAEQPARLYPEILAGSMTALGDQLGVPVSAEQARQFGESVSRWPPFPDTHDALVALGKRYKLIILSNVDQRSFVGSNRLLDVEFDRILTAEEIGSYKPSMRNFDALLQEAIRLGIEKGELLHVAQSLFHDHVPAKEAGLPTVWINRRHDRAGRGATPALPTDVTPDWEFPSMEAFASAVAESAG